MPSSSHDTAARPAGSDGSVIRLRRQVDTIPPTGLVLVAIASVQLGSSVAKQLFSTLGPGGAAFLRVAFGAVILLILVRPRRRERPVREYLLAALFGLSIAGMNLAFYSALDRIPLGIAVTLEFTGPLAVAVAGSRQGLDLVWIALAGAGVALLAPWGGISLSPAGVGLALLAGLLWASYILLTARVGRTFAGGEGLAVALCVGAIALLPIGVRSAGSHLVDPRLALVGVVVALLSSVIPYSLELQALRSLPTRVFGVLMSLEPAVAALVGFVVLGQVLGLRAILALLLVTVASFGACRRGPAPSFD